MYNTQDAAEVDVARLRVVAEAAVPICRARCLPGGDVLAELHELEVSVIDDAAIARVHGEFLGDPTPTDVITFDHGEILISAETAKARGAEFGNDAGRELALYLIHGLLHLAGFRDKTPEDAERMREVQEEVLDAVW